MISPLIASGGRVGGWCRVAFSCHLKILGQGPAVLAADRGWRLLRFFTLVFPTWQAIIRTLIYLVFHCCTRNKIASRKSHSKFEK